MGDWQVVGGETPREGGGGGIDISAEGLPGCLAVPLARSPLWLPPLATADRTSEGSIKREPKGENVCC